VQAVAIIQARLDSTRLPGKVLLPLGEEPMLWHVVQRVRAAPGVDQVVVATSEEDRDDPIRDFCRIRDIPCFAGSKADVLDRFYHCANAHDANPILRITADCPLIDPYLIGRVLECYRAGGYDHVGLATGAGALNMDGRRFPDGLDVECFSLESLGDAWKSAESELEREHVTPFIWKNPNRFALGVLMADRDYSQLRWTVDNSEDLEVVRQIYGELWKEDSPPFSMGEVLGFLEKRPDVAAHNCHFIGVEGYEEIWADDPDKELTQT
jgi:spore coat polysaccharide biosynthesis protein SpsF